MKDNIWAAQLDKKYGGFDTYFYDPEDAQYYVAEDVSEDTEIYESVAIDTEEVPQDVRQYLAEFFQEI